MQSVVASNLKNEELNQKKIYKRGILDSLRLEKYVIDWNFFDISKSEKDKIKIIQI